MKKILIASGIVLGLICSLALLNVRVHAVDIYVLTGTVRNPSNQPVSQVKVTATTPGTLNVVGSATLTDATGKYNLSMASGNYDIYFSPPAAYPQNSIIKVNNYSITGNQTLDQNFAKRSYSLSGRIVDSVGLPFPNLDVILSDGLGTSRTAKTDADGLYSVVVPSGSYSVSLKGGSASWGINLFTVSTGYTAGLTTTNLTKDFYIQTTKINVISYNNAGGSRYGSDVVVAGQNSGGSTSIAPGSSTATLGNFGATLTLSTGPTSSFGTIVGAIYPVGSICRTIGTGSASYKDCNKTAITASDIPQTVSLPQATPFTDSVSGHLTTSTGDPVAGATVTLASYDDTSTQTTTDQNGYYIISAAQRKYSLRLSGSTNNFTFSLKQPDVNPSINLMSGGMNRDLAIPVSTVTVNGYDASAFRPYFTGTVSGSSSQGTTYLYAGDPGMSMSISNTSATISANQLSVQLKSINGTTYSALGKTSSSTAGSICEEVDVHVYDCIGTPITITGDTTVTLPHTY